MHKGQETQSQKGISKKHADSFRGICFDDWMELAMQVRRMTPLSFPLLSAIALSYNSTHSF